MFYVLYLVSYAVSLNFKRGLNPVAQEALTSAISNAINNVSQKSKETKSTISEYSEQTRQKLSAKTKEAKVTLGTYAEQASEKAKAKTNAMRSTLSNYKQQAAEKLKKSDPSEISEPVPPSAPTVDQLLLPQVPTSELPPRPPVPSTATGTDFWPTTSV